ncbi:hypothetical protein F3Y22_tig00110515pilonHSYRG00147 [Hibiscus syriacus]|uniref:E3 ubiquitin-protein ligase WAV3-like C-terminal domain-containing protein n=1 Tax=Hibiscus syriacus TaxID=106335 RepID=A0A6A3ACN4_HIBSY|nr:hypothetical protein F3Y22_tig00110515pilonHSYRG00147 [Hibiscus syriacus]
MYGRDQVLVVPQSDDIRSSTPGIQRFRFFFITNRAIAESRRLIECSNDLTSAHHLLASARALLMQSNLLAAEEYVQGEREREREAIMVVMDENGEPLTPSSAWRAAEKLAKVAIMRKSLNRASDLHGFENARF